MRASPRTSEQDGWLDASGLPHIIRTLGIAVHPAKIGIALVAILATFILGGTLDWVWSLRGGVDPTTITQFADALERGDAYAEPSGNGGVFKTWCEHERSGVTGLLIGTVDWVIPGDTLGAGTPLDAYVRSHARVDPLRNFIDMVYGVGWMFRYHTLFFALFGVGALLIWSWAGGAICRIAAVQFAHSEKLRARPALAYAREKLVGGFAIAPCIPLVFIGLILVFMLLGGLLLRVPILGDLLGGLGFGLGLLGGFLIVLLLIGLLVGGSFFFPAVAAEGSDAFDAFSRGISYPLSKPWKTILYALVSLVFIGVCWLFVRVFAYYMLVVTRSTVGLGATWFGLWERGVEGGPADTLQALWPLSGFDHLYAFPSVSLSWHEYIAAVPIGLWVLLVVGLMWSFLASFYFSMSTVIYFLLRRDVDGVALDEVWLPEDDGAAVAPFPTGSSSTPGGSPSQPPDDNDEPPPGTGDG